MDRKRREENGATVLFCCFVLFCFVRMSAAERVALVRVSESTVRLHCIMSADLFIADMVTMRLESIEERRRGGSEPERNGGFFFFFLGINFVM